MSWNLFLDDERHLSDPYWMPHEIRALYRDEPWVIIRSGFDAQDYIKEHGFPTRVSFDHDLGDRMPTGMDIGKWLIELDLDEGGMPDNFEFFVHSMNPVGAQNITALLTNYLKTKNKNGN